MASLFSAVVIRPTQVLFCFENPCAMLRKLAALLANILSQVRHVRVTGSSFALRLRGSRRFFEIPKRWPLVAVFKLLPGLRLDQLTILGGDNPVLNYEILNGLVNDGTGWKTLRYISHSSEMLGYSSAAHQFSGSAFENWESWPGYWRKPQPRHWQDILERRDGSSSNPSVTIYRATEPDRYGWVLSPNKRARYEQDRLQSQYTNNQPYVFEEDPALMDYEEPDKEIMIVVTRGHGVDYEEKENSPFIMGDIRNHRLMTWAEIHTEFVDGEYSEYEDSYYTKDSVQADSYQDPYEYAKEDFDLICDIIETDSSSPLSPANWE